MSAQPTEAAIWRQIRQGHRPSAAAIAAAVDGDQVRLGSLGAAQSRDRLSSQVLGLGPLEPLLADPGVTDILVNGPDNVWIDRGAGLERAGADLADEGAVRRLAVRLAGLSGHRLDDASPFVDGLLPGGIRLHAVLPPLVADGTHLSLRVPRRHTPDLDQLREWGMFDREGEHLLRRVVSSRLAFVISGGTGAGKTTLLAAMLGAVGPTERIVIVEDVAELCVRHPHVVLLQARVANVEGRGAVAMTTVVRQSLRMRPDRLVVGEVRGAEVRELLTALNTGHEGGCGTVHANSCADVVNRFQALGALADLSPAAVHAQLASAIDLVVHVARVGARRCVQEIALVAADDAGHASTTTAWSVSERALPGRRLLEELLMGREAGS